MEVNAFSMRSMLPMNWLPLLANGLLFNVSWFVIVISESAWIASWQVVIHLCVHFAFIARGLAELRLLALVAVCGLLLDHILFAVNVFTLAGTHLPPLWLSFLWPVFATTLCHAFAGLQGRWVLAGLIGAFGGAGSYVAGVGLTDIDFGSALWSPLFIALLWAVLFPSMLALAQQVAPEKGE